MAIFSLTVSLLLWNIVSRSSVAQIDSLVAKGKNEVKWQNKEEVGYVSCEYRPKNTGFSTIRWYFPSNTTVTYLYDEFSNVVPSPRWEGRATHNHTEDRITLVIQNVTKDDHGTYYCEFVASGNSLKNDTGLRITDLGDVTNADRTRMETFTNVTRAQNNITCHSEMRCARPAFNLALQLIEPNGQQIQGLQVTTKESCPTLGADYEKVKAQILGSSVKKVRCKVVLQHISTGNSPKDITANDAASAVCPTNCHGCDEYARCTQCESGYQVDDSGGCKKSAGSNAALIGGVVGGVAAALIIIGVIVFFAVKKTQRPLVERFPDSI